MLGLELQGGVRVELGDGSCHEWCQGGRLSQSAGSELAMFGALAEVDDSFKIVPGWGDKLIDENMCKGE